jgi:hypothetical protein
MALNQSAINVKPINGAEIVQYSQALNIVSTATASFLKGAATLKSILSSSLSTIVISRVFPKELIASAVTSSVSLVRSIGKLIQYTLDNNAEILTSQASHYLTITYNSVTTSTIVKALTRTLTSLSTSIATILKSVNHILTASVTSTVTLIRSALKLVIALVTSLVTLVTIKISYITLTAISTVTASLVKSVGKLLTISVNCGIILGKLVNKFISLISTIISTLVASGISFKNIAADRLMYAAVRFRKIFY